MLQKLLPTILVAVLVASPVSAQMSGYYGGTAPERSFAKDIFEAWEEKGVEYVSVSFRLATLTIYPSEDLFKAWLADEEKTEGDLGGWAVKLLVEVREKKPRGEVKVSVKIRFPNERRSYDRIIAELTSTEGNEGTLAITVK
jgi:hypothetical protein